MRRCSRCNISSPVEAFSNDKYGKGGKRAYCRSCARDYDHQYRKSVNGSSRRRAYKKTARGRLHRVAYRHRRRAYSKQAGPLTAGTIEGVIRRNLSAYSRLTCVYCKADLEGQTWHLEHLTPLSRAGTNHRDNLAVSCPTCNVSKGVKTYSETDRMNEGHLLVDAHVDRLKLKYCSNPLKSVVS